MNARETDIRVLNLRVGDLVQVRAEHEILATLDANGALDGLPFMPEMLQFCGQRVRVEARADKTCDTINYSGARRMYRTVHLEGLRCDGGAHAGCQARCLLFWKEAWLKPVEGRAALSDGNEVGTGRFASADGREPRDTGFLVAATTYPQPTEDGQTRYRCQATELLRASSPLAWWDIRQYVRDVRSGNVGVLAVVRAALFRVFEKMLKVGAYRALIWSYNRLQSWRGGTPYPFTGGTLQQTPTATLDLKPGEFVRVKSQREILETVNNRSRNRGLSFDPEMVRYCGEIHKVLARVDRIVDERTGKIINLPRDCIILEGAVCRAEYSNCRLFCPRKLYPFWREIWLKRIEVTGAAPRSPGQPSRGN